MSVKPSQTAARTLRVLETIASHQPVGTRALARITGDDKSSIQRAITTLAGDGWIQLANKEQVSWEVSPKILTIAGMVFGGIGIRQRARPALERLRDETSETVVLVTLVGNTMGVADIVESPRELRVVLKSGEQVTIKRTAAGRSILSHLSLDRQTELLGEAPDRQLEELYEEARQRGFAVSERETYPDATSVAAPIFDYSGVPCGAIAVIGPSERMTPEIQAQIGASVIQVALSLSSGIPALSKD